MKREKISNAMNNISDEHIEEAASYTAHSDVASKKNLWKKWGAIAACFMLTAAAAVGMWQGGFFTQDPVQSTVDKRWPEKWVYTNHAGEIVKITPWDERSISEQYSALSYNSANYSSNAAGITADYIGTSLGSYALIGYDTITDTTYTAQGTVCAIKNISPDCAVGVRFEGQTDYYVYVNDGYRPATLKDFIDDLNLTETLSFGSIYYEWMQENGEIAHIEFKNLNDAVVWNMLLSDTSLECVEFSGNDILINGMSISVSIPLLGYENISLGVTENGYLTTNILNTGKAFFIGTKKAQMFMEYVIENCEGYEIVYIEGDILPE